MKKELPPSLIKKIEKRKEPFQDNLIEWGGKNYRDFNWRNNRTPYNVLVSEVLLRRTTAQAVDNIYEEFLRKYPDLLSLQNSKDEELECLLSRIGYHKRRTTIFKTIASYILEYYNGEIPYNQSELLDIPQVGHYITNCVLTFGYGVPTSIVDTNVERIFKRVFSELGELRTLRIIREVADLLAPENNNQEYNYALLDLGGLLCKPRNPYCVSCDLKSVCDYSKNH